MAFFFTKFFNKVKTPKSPQELAEILRNREQVVMECYTNVSNCCRQHKSLMGKCAKSFKNIKFVRAKDTYLKGLIEGFGVESLPVYIFLKNGREVSRLKAENIAEIDLESKMEKPLPKGLLKKESKKWIKQNSRIRSIFPKNSRIRSIFPI